MKTSRVIGVLLAAAIVVSACSKIDTIQKEKADDIPVSGDLPEIIQTETETETEYQEDVPFEFNAHVYSPTIALRIPQDYWDSFYNLCDAIRAGESTFECSSQEAYDWCTDVGVLCCYFPAAGTRVEPSNEDGSAAFENGIGKIRYTMPVEEYLARQNAFENLIEDIINSCIESDDTDYEKALKLYLYVAGNYEYEDDFDYDDNYVYHTFTTKKGVCGNFGSVYAYLLLEVGIDAMQVGCFEEDMCHAWTYAFIDGRGYYIDPTWALKSTYDGTDYIYLDYFLMSDTERNDDGCLVRDLTTPVLPEFWINMTSITLVADDNHYNLRNFCNFVSLDEDNKILYYTDMSGNEREFYYEK